MIIETLTSIGIYSASVFAAVSAVATAVNWYRYSKSAWANSTGISFLKHCYMKHFQLDASARKGYSGEFELSKSLEKVKGEKKLLFNVLLPDGKSGTTEIDALMIHETGIYVIENKNYGGKIGCFSEDRGRAKKLGNVKPYADRWDIVYNSNTIRSMRNPVLQNEKHVNCIKAQLRGRGIGTQRFYSYVTFNDNAKVKGAPFDFVLSANGRMLMLKHLVDDLNSKIATRGRIISSKKMNSISAILEPYAWVSKRERKEHVKNIKKAISSLETKKDVSKEEPPPRANELPALNDIISSAEKQLADNTSSRSKTQSKNYLNLIQK